MGAAADMMINGMMCCICGVFIGDDVGYPRECPICESKSDKEEEANETPRT